MWRVVIHNDNVNSFVFVAHVVHTLCAVSLEDATNLAAVMHHERSAEVAAFPDQHSAEQLVVALQRHGLDAMIRHH